MGGSFRLLSVRGISIEVNASWLLVLALLSWSLADSYYPLFYPGRPDTQYWGLGVLTALAFLFSVLLHELAHSLTALRLGIPVRSITLYMFGGVSMIARDADKPRDEMLLALAGPAASVALAVLFGGMALLGRVFSPMLLVGGLYLAGMNAVLAVFNLLPGFPLDGGRVLRAFIWSAGGNVRLATRVAAWCGEAGAYVMLALGLYLTLTGDMLSGVWLMVIGWFLASSASGAYRQVVTQQLLRSARVDEVMSTDVHVVGVTLPVDRLVSEYVLRHSQQAFPVVNAAGGLAGLVSLHDVKKAPPSRWPSMYVSEVMRPAVALPALGLADDGRRALEALNECGCDALPVLHEGRVVGMLTRGDLSRFVRIRLELGM